jgi:hypothetical protein
MNIINVDGEFWNSFNAWFYYCSVLKSN